MSRKAPSVLSEDEIEVRPPASQNPPKIGFVSLGCPKNLVDSEVMMGILAHNGAELVRRAEDADVIVVHTCYLIESAQQTSVYTILEIARQQNEGHTRKLIVSV